MQIKKSIIVPIVAILSGVLLQLKSLGFIGQSIPEDIIFKLWPLLIVAAALDLLFEQRRLAGALVLLFFAGALFSTQFLDAGWNSDLWLIFRKYWPILLIIFGIDIIFSGRSLVNIIVIILAVVILVYVLLAALNIPILSKLPFQLPSISQFIPTPIPNTPNGTQMFPAPEADNTRPGPETPVQTQSPVTYSGGHLTIASPSQQNARLNLNAASGRISLKGGLSGNFIDGTVKTDTKEQFTYETALNGVTAVYDLKSSGSSERSDSSQWELSLTRERRIDLNVVLEKGYVKADMRGMNLNGASIVNRLGPIDVMMPLSGGKITVNAMDGNVRIYVPGSVRVSCKITGASQINYPQRNYALNNGVVSPRSSAQNVIEVEVLSNNGTVQIIESE